MSRSEFLHSDSRCWVPLKAACIHDEQKAAQDLLRWDQALGSLLHATWCDKVSSQTA
jgi:hypothetical protein